MSRDKSATTSAEPRRNRRVVPAASTPAKAYAPPAIRVPLRERLVRARGRLAAAWARTRGPLASGLKVVSVLAAIGFAVATFRVVERWARTAPQFEIAEITVEGGERLSEAEILEAAGIAVGENVFSRSPEDARATLAEHPWIADARVERRLPGTFHVHVTERRAVAILMLDEPYLVSDEGTLIASAEPGEEGELPLVVGVDRTHFLGDQAFRTHVLLDAVTLLSEYDASGLDVREPISEIRVERDGELTLFVGDDAMEVRLGAGPFRRKLDRFAQILRELRSRDARAAYVLLDNLRSPGRVTVRLR